MSRFAFAVKCRNCGNWCALETKNPNRAVLSCKFCTRRTKVIGAKRMGPLKGGLEAAFLVKYLNGKRGDV